MTENTIHPKASEPADLVTFFNRYWAALADRHWPSLILHSWKDLPETIMSDVDYAVAGASAGDLLSFLSEFSRSLEWRLVQVIEHEPNAYFCVCMQYGGSFESLALDVTWDYRRIGHLLVPAKTLQAGSRTVQGKTFRVPSPGAEAVYILAKAAAKGKDFTDVKSRLFELFAEDPADCSKSLDGSLDFKNPSGVSADALLRDVEQWFPGATAFKNIRSGRRFGPGELKLYLRRIRRPTGLWLKFYGRDADHALIEKITEPLIQLFRRAHRHKRVPLFQIPKVIFKVIRTSLVVEHHADSMSCCEDYQISIDISQATEARDSTLEILDRMAARVARRISNLPS
jgi:hypothetical protein